MQDDTPSAADPAPGKALRRARSPYKVRGPETWALIRESYLAGASANTLAKRYDVTVDAIRRRCWREKWTKRDHALGQPPPPGAAAEVAPLFPPEGLAERARSVDADVLQAEAADASARAMRLGRMDEALALAKLAESYGRMAQLQSRLRFKESQTQVLARQAEQLLTRRRTP